jgi:hypothetical protein
VGVGARDPLRRRYGLPAMATIYQFGGGQLFVALTPQGSIRLDWVVGDKVRLVEQ